MTSRRDLGRIQDQLEELFADLWQVPGFAGLRRGFRPHVDSYLTSDPAELVVVVDLAGVAPGDVQLVVADGALSISGVRRRPAPECRVSYHQIEIDHGQFNRRVPLPPGVDAEGAEATYERGLLRIVFPVTPEPTRERATIEVKARA